MVMEHLAVSKHITDYSECILDKRVCIWCIEVKWEIGKKEFKPNNQKKLLLPKYKMKFRWHEMRNRYRIDVSSCIILVARTFLKIDVCSRFSPLSAEQEDGFFLQKKIPVETGS